MNTAIIIVTYNRLPLLKECIDCALNQIDEQVELFIINNASTDGTKEYLEEMIKLTDNLFFQTMESNVGGAGGFAEGLKAAYYNSNCEMFLLIDDDAMLMPDYILRIDENRSRKYGAYAGTVCVNNNIDTSHRLCKKTGRITEYIYEQGNFECDIATFCGLLITRKIIKKIGFPREDFFIWNDDTEYSLRIGKYSKILNISDARINHKTVFPQDEKPIRDTWKEYYGMRNIISIYKEYKMLKCLLYKLVRCFGKAFIYEIKAISNWKLRNDYRYNARLRFDAIIDGLSGRMGINIKYIP